MKILRKRFISIFQSYTVYMITWAVLIRPILNFVIVPMAGSGVFMYPQTIFALIAFHWSFMGWHLFTRKSAILERSKKEGWVILAETGVRKKRDAEVQFATEGLLDKQLSEK